MRLGALLLAGTLALAACEQAQPTPFASPDGPPSMEISHWPSLGTQGFHFLPWEAPEWGDHHPFDPNVQPTVRICRITGGVCGVTLASFTRASGSYGQRVTVNTTDEEYSVSWPTGSTGASAGQIYRVSVEAGGRTLGFADVLMVSSLAQYFSTDTDVYVPWFAGLTLPIQFRIEQEIPASITFSPISVSLGVGEGVAVSATVRGLNGQVLNVADMGWMIENASPAPGNVAELDSGLVVGDLPGTATLYTWAADLVAQVTVTVTDTRRAWTAMSTPADGQGNRGMWGSSSTNIFAASNTGVLRWNGAAWTYADPVRWRATHAVFGFGASDVWAVGDAGIILRFNGTAWSALRYNGTTVSPQSLTAWDDPAQKVTLRGVWGSAANNVWVVGAGGTALRWNGTAWTVTATGTTADLTAVWGSSATNVYATTSDGRVLRWNGTAWSTVAGVQVPGGLNSVWGSSATNVYVAGNGGALYRFNGTTWSRNRLPWRAPLYAVWGSSATSVYVAGAAGALYRWDGTRWTPEKATATGAQVYGLWGTGTDVWAAGAVGIAKR